MSTSSRFVCSWCKAEDASPNFPVVQSAMQPKWCIKCVDATLKGEGERRKNLFACEYQKPGMATPDEAEHEALCERCGAIGAADQRIALTYDTGSERRRETIRYSLCNRCTEFADHVGAIDVNRFFAKPYTEDATTVEAPKPSAQHKDRQRVIDRALETGRKYTDEQVVQYPLLRVVALDFIRSYRGTNSYVQDIAVKLVDYGTLTPPQLRGALNVMVAEARLERAAAKADALYFDARHNDGAPSSAIQEFYIDLRRREDKQIADAGDAIPPADERANEVAQAIPNGTYTVILDDTYSVIGDYAGKAYRTLRVKDCPDHFTVKAGTQLIEFLNGPDNTKDFAGFAFLAGRKVSIWKKYRNARDLSAAADRLVADPMSAAAEYVKRSNRCFVCNRPLTTPESIARGIGPICFEKVSAMGFEFNLTGDQDQAHEQVTLAQMIDARIRRRQQIKEHAEVEEKRRKNCKLCLGEGETPDDDLAAALKIDGAVYVPCAECRPKAYARELGRIKAEVELDRSLENVAVDISDYTARGDQPLISREQAQAEIDEIFPE